MNISFRNFLTENKIEKIDSPEIIHGRIAQECRQFLTHSGGMPVFRGIKQAFSYFYSDTPIDRVSKDSGKALTFVLNALVYHEFGIKNIRSKCFFGTHDLHVAQGYGPTYAIFPTDGFECVWSKDINDPYADDYKIYSRIKHAMIVEGFNTINDAVQVNQIFDILASQIKPDYWVDNTNNGLEYPNKILGFTAIDKAFSKHLIDNDIEKTVKLFIKALNKAFISLEYDISNLTSALKSNHEIMFTDCSGYYGVYLDDYDDYHELIVNIEKYK